jgi:hypothetical protein
MKDKRKPFDYCRGIANFLYANFLEKIKKCGLVSLDLWYIQKCLRCLILEFIKNLKDLENEFLAEHVSDNQIAE